MGRMTDIERALVIGATGNIGRAAVELLLRRGVAVRGLARDASSLPDGVEGVSADVRDVEAVRGAARDVDAVLLIWPFMAAENIAEVAGVLGPRVVYVSAMSVRDDLPPAHNGVWGQVEDAIRGAGAEWTFLRASGFATNTLQWAAAVRAGREVRIPYLGAARSLIHERDIAEAAVVALTEPGHARRSYVLSGPEAVTQAQQVHLIGLAAGRPAVAAEADPGEARAEMLAWADPAFADQALAYWASLVDDPEPVADGVLELTGHPARSFAQWAADHAADFRPLSAEDIARRYAAAMRAGRMERAVALYDPAVVRAAPLEGAEVRGLPEVLAGGERLTAGLDIHGVTVQGPYLGDGQFAVRFVFEQTRRSTGERFRSAKMSLFTVAGGAITREEVHYFDPPA
jgi:uncharacterized protein YbjT (DUF2867 family)/ketosteroid isomerase-like protein